MLRSQVEEAGRGFHFRGVRWVGTILAAGAISSVASAVLERPTEGLASDPALRAVLLAEPSAEVSTTPCAESGVVGRFFSISPEAALSEDSLRRLEAGFADAAARAAALLAASDAAESIVEFFPGEPFGPASPASAEELIAAVREGRFAVEVRPTTFDVLRGAIAGFASEGPSGSPLILVSEEWLEAGVSHEGIVRLALEELGHAFDAHLHGAFDSPGDEGERFAAKILGVEIEPEVLARIEREDDRKSIRLDGREIAIEEAAITFTAAFLATKPNSINTGSAVYGSLYFVSDPNNATFGTSLSSNKLYGFFDYQLTPGGTTYTAHGYFTFRAPTGGALIQALYFDLDDSGIGTDTKIVLSGVSYDLLLVLTNVSAYGPNVSGINSSANSSSAGAELDAFVAATAPNAASSTIAASPTSVTADGTTSTVTVTVRKADNSGLSGATVVLDQLSGETSTISPASATTDSNGDAVFTVSYTTATAVTYQATATAAGTETIITDTVTVTFVAGEATTAQTTVTAGTTSIAADGTSTSTITVQLKDQYGNDTTTLPGGQSLTLATSAGTLVGSLTTSGGGTYTQSLQSSTTAGTATLTASIGSTAVTDTATVTFTAGEASTSTSTVSSSPTSIVADGSTTSTITVQLKDQYGNDTTTLPGGQSLTLATSAGTLVGSLATSGGGTYTQSLQSSTTAGTATLTASIGSTAVTDTATVSFTAGPATTIAVNGGDNQTAIVGTAVSTAPSVLVTDANGNAVSGVSVTFAVASGGGTVSPTTAVTTDASGIAAATSWTLGSTAGSNTLTATSGSLSGSPLSFTATAVQATSLSIATQPSSTATNDAAFAQQPAIQLLDGSSNPIAVSGIVVTASIATGSGSLGGTVTATTDANGVATFTDLSITGLAESYTLSFSASGLTGATSNSISLSAGAATQYLVTPSTTSPAAGSGVAVTAQLADSSGNAVSTSGLTVSWSKSDANGSFSSATSTTDSSGVATVTLTTHTVSGTTTTVTATTGSVAGTSSSITTVAGPASTSTSTVSSSPTSIVADGSTTSTITVQLKDQYGNDLTASGGTVAFSTSSGTMSSVTDVGDGTYTATLTSSTTAGTATVTATLGGAAISDDASVDFTAGSATQLVITTEPVGGASGSPLATQPVLVVQDANGNTVTTDSTTQITVAIQSGAGGTLGGTTMITVASGVGTFTNLTLAGTVGTNYVLRFTASPSLTTVDSSNVQVTGPASCGSFVLGSLIRNFPAGGGVSAVTVETDPNCAWTATSSAAWLSVTGGASGTGNGEIFFSATSNTANADRTATITVTNALSSEIFTVTQTRQSVPAAWGLAKYGLNAIPASIGSQKVSMVAANRRDNLAVLEDGTVAVWGFNGDGQGDIPAALLNPATANVIQVSAGPRHMAALQADGTVVCWGRNVDGECNVPAGLVAISVSAGRAHTLAVRADGTVAAWGRNQVGQCNVPAGLSGVIAVAAGDWHSVALKSDGSVVAWGDNTWGQTNVPSALTSSAATVAKIAAGRNHTLALSSDRTIAAWGDNRQGQSTVRADLQNAATANVVAISGGRTSSVVLQADGTIVYLGTPPFGSGTTPAGVGVPTGVAAGDDVTVVIVPPAVAPPNMNGGAIGGGDVGATLLVPEQFATIGEAVVAAGSGSTILVGPGLYRETLDLGDRGLQLVALGGDAATVIDARGQDRSAITIAPLGEATTGLVTRVVGFTIVGGEAERGGGVRIDRTVAEIVDCLVRDNRADLGGGIAVSFGDLLLAGCVIEGNSAGSLGGGLHASASSVVISDSTIAANLAGEAGGGVWADAETIVMGEALLVCGNLPDETALEGEGPDEPPQPCPIGGDLDGDGFVGAEDLSLLLAAWGPCERCEADLDGDGEVDGADLGLLMSAWMAVAGGGA